MSKRLVLQWRHNERDGVSNHQPLDCLLNRLLRRRSKKTSKLRVTGLCAGNLPGTGEFPAQMASNAENVSIWWRHHEMHVDRWVKYIWWYILRWNNKAERSKGMIVGLEKMSQSGCCMKISFSLIEVMCICRNEDRKKNNWIFMI